MHVSKKLLSIFAAFGLAAFLTACDTEGPMEQAGEATDEAVENAGETAENIGEEAGETARNLGEEAEENTGT